jgi:hypothetical protein
MPIAKYSVLFVTALTALPGLSSSSLAHTQPADIIFSSATLEYHDKEESAAARSAGEKFQRLSDRYSISVLHIYYCGVQPRQLHISQNETRAISCEFGESVIVLDPNDRPGLAASN